MSSVSAWQKQQWVDWEQVKSLCHLDLIFSLVPLKEHLQKHQSFLHHQLLVLGTVYFCFCPLPLTSMCSCALPLPLCQMTRRANCKWFGWLTSKCGLPTTTLLTPTLPLKHSCGIKAVEMKQAKKKCQKYSHIAVLKCYFRPRFTLSEEDMGLYINIQQNLPKVSSFLLYLPQFFFKNFSLARKGVIN